MPYVVREGEMPVSKEYLHLHNESGRYLQEQFFKYKGEGEENIFRWIKTEPTMPSFSDLIFSWKNEIFVVIPLQTYQDAIIYPPDKRVLPRMIDLAIVNDLRPCIFPLWNDQKQFEDWNLFDALEYEKKGKLISLDPIKIATDEKKRLSDWELYDFAIMCFITELRKKNLKITSWHDVPQISPQVFFYNSEGKLSWAHIRYRIGNTVKAWDSSLSKMDARIGATYPYNGKAYYVTVDILTEDKEKPYRKSPIAYSINDTTPSL